MSRSAARGSAVVRALELVRIFCPEVSDFGRIEASAAEAVPAEARHLLDHHGHMTVTMERHHGCEVMLCVLDEAVSVDHGGRYAREILLARPDGVVVQYGIVRIDMAVIPPAVAAEVRAGRKPLGRIMLAAGLLCAVHEVSLLRIEPGPRLVAAFGLHGDVAEAFGRVAEILVAGRPAIELLEIVAPDPTAAIRH